MENLPEFQPAAYIIAGLVVLIFPRILNYIVAGYLIFLGASELWPTLLS
ncbi:DUF3096 domain-containing protein [Acuticoccus yangtzensis]|nr:DUF3096 domain-containing protein [Acuticoccus yangtzensis]